MLKKEAAANLVRELTGATMKDVALKLGYDPGNFDRRVKRGLNADLLLEIVNAYDLDPIAALRSAGLIPREKDLTPNEKIRHVMAMLDEVRKEFLIEKELAQIIPIEQTYELNTDSIIDYYQDQAAADSSEKEQEGEFDDYHP